MSRLLSLFAAVALPVASVAAGGEVEVVRAPDGAVQPHVAIDRGGKLHLVYFLVDPSTTVRKRFMQSGNLFYAVRRPGDDAWSDPVRVNSQVNQVSRMSSPRIAVGRDGRVHVAWSRFKPRGMWYARMAGDRASFEKSRNLLARDAVGIEAGPAVTADGKGNVYVVWHEGPFKDEAKRIVAVRCSTDDGKTFSRPRRANPAEMGVCSCCNLHAMTDAQGELHIAFRASVDGIHKDMVLLASEDHGETFAHRKLDEWEHPGCPTSGTYLADGASKTLVTWETEGVVYLGDVTGEMLPVAMPRSSSLQKHPTMAVNGDGEALVAWIELTKKPIRKRLHWQVFDAKGKPSGARSADEVILTNTNSPALAARPDGSFVMVY